MYLAVHCRNSGRLLLMMLDESGDINENFLLRFTRVHWSNQRKSVIASFNIWFYFVSWTDYSRTHPGVSPVDQGFSIPNQFLNEPLVANVAMQYGQALVGSGTQLVGQGLEKYIPVSSIKYYFAVDTRYVTKKLGLLFFPFTHSVSSCCRL